MEFELKGALKKYQRMRAWRHFGLLLALPIGFAVPWYLEFSRTDTLICVVGALVLSMVGHLEIRMKTMQVRLAGMDDHLVALRGMEPEGNLIGELNDW